MIKQIIVFLGLAGASVAYAFTKEEVPVAPPATTDTTATPAVSQVAPAPTNMMTGAMPPKTGMMSAFRDGTYKGSVADAFYGLVQVQAMISGGRLSHVTFLSYPFDNPTSRFINSQAMPLLTQEAVTVQSANVNTVSGATETSGAFRESLAVALAAAKN